MAVTTSTLSLGITLKKMDSPQCPSVLFSTPCLQKFLAAVPMSIIPILHREKLDTRAIKCVFVGYSPNQKGYKCYCPTTKRFFVSLDVPFLENQLLYPNPTLQGEVQDEEKLWECIPLPNVSAIPEPEPSQSITPLIELETGRFK